MNGQALRKIETASFELHPLTPTIGAEITGVDLREPLDATTLADMRAALLEWKVLFFREQDVTTEQHLTFAASFGKLEVHPFAPHKPGYPEVLAITHNRESRGRENTWHSDVTWRLEPSLGSILRSLEIPPVGGDTLFADMYAAYDGLTDEVKERIDGKTAIHDFGFFREAMRKRGKSEAEIEAFNKAYPPAEHPVVRTHPETGKKGIYVNAAFTKHIVDMDAAESKSLLRHLYAQAAIPEYQCRFRWTVNALAFWDNRASQHYAASDYWPAVRRMERVTIIGDKPR
jgi:taurine dioxygenase